MFDKFFLNIDKETFYKCYKTFSNKNLCNILNNSKNVNDYLDMDILIIIRIINNLNNNVKENLIKNINIDNLIKLYTNDKISKYDIWKNKNVYRDLNLTIKTLNKLNLLFLINDIDDYNFDGNFIESQAFAYLAIRSYLKLPISFPSTTRCKKAISGGDILQNF